MSERYWTHSNTLRTINGELIKISTDVETLIVSEPHARLEANCSIFSPVINWETDKLLPWSVFSLFWRGLFLQLMAVTSQVVWWSIEQRLYKLKLLNPGRFLLDMTNFIFKFLVVWDLWSFIVQGIYSGVYYNWLKWIWDVPVFVKLLPLIRSSSWNIGLSAKYVVSVCQFKILISVRLQYLL